MTAGCGVPRLDVKAVTGIQVGRVPQTHPPCGVRGRLKPRQGHGQDRLPDGPARDHSPGRGDPTPTIRRLIKALTYTAPDPAEAEMRMAMITDLTELRMRLRDAGLPRPDGP